MNPQALQNLGLTQDQIEAIMALGALTGEEGVVAKQLEMAQQLKNQPGSQGRFTGRGYVAADPTEHIADALRGIRGEYNANQALQRQQQIADEQAAARSKFLIEWLKQRQLPTPTQTPGMTGGAPAMTAPYQPGPAAVPPNQWMPIR